VVFEMAAAEKIQEVTGCEPGYVGPLGLLEKGIKVYADEEVKTMVNAVCGANEFNHHYVNVVPERDFMVSEYTDLRLIEEGEPCPKCGAVLNMARGIEVGQVFKLGTKYSNALKATYVDEKGQENDIVMGCYGIGVSRTMAAAVEQNHDDNGIIWPMQIAPYQVVIVPVSTSDQQIWQAAELLYEKLIAGGVEVILDDRDERAGVKFKDADLIGYPVRVTIGKRFIEEKKMEIKKRWEKEASLVTQDEIIEMIENILAGS
jgi:prolyl-tRNA synthetase